MFNKENNYFEEKGAKHTAKEINQQPSTWAKTLNIVKEKKNELNAFLSNVLSKQDFEIIFTGAGTSEFTGDSVFPYLNSLFDYRVKSIGTTDIVASPYDYLHPTRYILMVSFARSGNSPESVATVNIANKVCKNVYHLFITCNKEGKLSLLANKEENCFCINLPDETNDLSFAMTSSYSSMYLAALVSLMQYLNIPFEENGEAVINNTKKFFEDISVIDKIISEFDYKNIVYLGSNCLKGVARESALKTCELTAGTIMTTYDTTMGFRHGPKSVVKKDTLTVVYVSDVEYTKQYDRDIILEIFNEHIGKILVVTNTFDQQLKDNSDYYICFNNKKEMESAFTGLQFITVGQLLGMLKAISMNNTPDNPCSTGQVSRVVHGVNIYEY